MVMTSPTGQRTAGHTVKQTPSGACVGRQLPLVSSQHRSRTAQGPHHWGEPCSLRTQQRAKRTGPSPFGGDGLIASQGAARFLHMPHRGRRRTAQVGRP